VSVTRVPKPWGEEIIFAHTEHYAGKILRIRAGESLSLQYHVRKDESIYLFQGSLRLRLAGAGGEREVERRLEPGDAVRLVPLTRHRMEALTDCVVFEVSTPELDDVVRLEDRYGRI
jgi:mannose-6-phosphate isomerase-like protein (cupin superfamily)